MTFMLALGYPNADITRYYLGPLLIAAVALPLHGGRSPVLAQEPAFDVKAHYVKRDYMAPMRDGVKLATDIYLPAKNGVAVQEPSPELKAALEAIVGPKEGGRSVVISPQSGVIVIRAMPDELRNVDQYLRATQLSVDRQVILEAKILEVELNSNFQSGINWAAFARNGNSKLSLGVLQPGIVDLPAAQIGRDPQPGPALRTPHRASRTPFLLI